MKIFEDVVVVLFVFEVIKELDNVAMLEVAEGDGLLSNGEGICFRKATFLDYFDSDPYTVGESLCLENSAKAALVDEVDNDIAGGDDSGGHPCLQGDDVWLWILLSVRIIVVRRGGKSIVLWGSERTGGASAAGNNDIVWEKLSSIHGGAVIEGAGDCGGTTGPGAHGGIVGELLSVQRILVGEAIGMRTKTDLGGVRS